MQLAEDYLETENFWFVEHYRDGERDETFDLVDFSWDEGWQRLCEPVWTSFSKDKLDELIGF